MKQQYWEREKFNYLLRLEFLKYDADRLSVYLWLYYNLVTKKVLFCVGLTAKAMDEDDDSRIKTKDVPEDIKQKIEEYMNNPFFDIDKNKFLNSEDCVVRLKSYGCIVKTV